MKAFSRFIKHFVVFLCLFLLLPICASAENTCDTEKELLQCLEDAIQTKKERIWIYCSPTLYSSCEKNGFASLYKQASLSCVDLYVEGDAASNSIFIAFHNFDYSYYCNTLQDLVMILQDCLRTLDPCEKRCLTIFFSPQLRQYIDFDYIGLLARSNGMELCQFGVPGNNEYSSMMWFKLRTGPKLVRMHTSGNRQNITDREIKTYEAASKLAQEACAYSSNDIERARYIYRALGKRITYDTNSPDCDSAIGAFLEGRAKCDGYADTFYLTATLAGLDVKYIQGDSNKAKAAGKVSGHEWNIVRLNNEWRYVDVTWGHGHSSDKYFSFGSKKASEYYSWIKLPGMPYVSEK